MQILEALSRIWDKAAPILGVLLFLVKVLTFFFDRKPDVSRPRSWRSGGGGPSTTRFHTQPRPTYPKRWSVNDIPRP
jgi:hypothetical protein